MPGKKIALALALLAIGGFAAWRYHSANTGGETQPSIASPFNKGDAANPRAPATSGAATPNATSAANAPNAAATPRNASTGQAASGSFTPATSHLRFTRSNDFKKTYDEYRNQVATDQNAAYFLHDMLLACSGYVRNGKEKALGYLRRDKYPPEIQAMREAAFEQLWAKCAGFPSMSIDEVSAEIASIVATAEKSGNPQLAARELSRLGRKYDADADAKAIALLELQDPVVLWELKRLAATNPELKTIAGNVGNPRQETLREAWAMAACDAGYDCNSLLSTFCAYNGVCGVSDYADVVRQSTLSPTDFEVANQIRLKIGEALRTRDWAALGFVKRK